MPERSREASKGRKQQAREGKRVEHNGVRKGKNKAAEQAFSTSSTNANAGKRGDKVRETEGRNETIGKNDPRV